MFASFVTFFLVGLVHCIIVYPFLGFSYTTPTVFMCFYAFNELSFSINRVFDFNRLSKPLNTSVNLGLILISFEIGFYLNSLLV